MTQDVQDDAPQGKITTYDPAMAPRVAEMFTAFNELWPGGFGGRVPYDEQRVRDWLDDTSAIADLIAVDADGEPVGYCGLYPHWRDRHAAYVSVLGVVPRVKGKKYGKRLLLRAIEIAAERGISRVDLHTWSGNLNAVPLYKKVGMFWVPETSVYMQDYVPGLLRMALAGEWFGQHPDWYTCFQRELAQAPDEQAVDGMQLYRYVFEAGGDRLAAEVDRYGWGFCGVERVLDGQRLAVWTRLNSHEIQIGVPNAMTISVDNEGVEPLSMALTVEPFEGMRWAEAFPLTLEVPAGETASVCRAFVVDRTAETYRDGEASEVIGSRLLVNGQVLDLVTGGKIQAAVELAHQDGYLAAPIGSETRVYLDLHNHVAGPVKGRVEVFTEGLPVSQSTIPFAMEQEQVSGIAVPVSLPGSPASTVYTLHATAVLERGETSEAMPEFCLSLVPELPELAAVVQGRDAEHLHVVTDQVEVAVDLEGGTFHVGRRGLPGPWQHIETELGPPFGLSLDHTLRYEWSARHDGEGLTLVLRAESRQWPELQIRKCVRVWAGRREVEHWTTVTPLQPGVDTLIGARVHPGGRDGLSINPFASVARGLVPLGGQVVVADAVLPVLSENLIPQESEEWKETWTAVQYMADDSISAWMWVPDRVSRVKVSGGSLSSLEVEPVPVRPGQTMELYHLWYGLGYVRLEEVRARWSQLVGRVAIPYRERTFGADTVPPLAVSMVGERIVHPGTVRRTIELSFATGYPLQGELRLAAPEGWGAAFLTAAGVVPVVSMPEAVPAQPARLEIELTVPEQPKAASATIELQIRGEFEMCYPLSVLVAQDGKVEIREDTLAGQPTLSVANGVLRFHTCATVGGNLIRLQDAEGRSFLYDHFPEVKPYVFLSHHIGGVEPLVFWPRNDDPFEEPEAVTVEPIADGAWRGTEASWTVTHRERLRGQRYRLAYLVLPGCPLVRIRLRHENPTPRRLRWVGGLLLNLALQEGLEETVLQVPGATQRWTRHRTPMPFFGQTDLRQPWAWVARKGTSLTMFAPEGQPGSAAALDLGALIVGLLLAELEAGPEGENAIEFAVALNQPPERTQELIRAASRPGID